MIQHMHFGSDDIKNQSIDNTAMWVSKYTVNIGSGIPNAALIFGCTQIIDTSKIIIKTAIDDLYKNFGTILPNMSIIPPPISAIITKYVAISATVDGNHSRFSTFPANASGPIVKSFIAQGIRNNSATTVLVIFCIIILGFTVLIVYYKDKFLSSYYTNFYFVQIILNVINLNHTQIFV